LREVLRQSKLDTWEIREIARTIAAGLRDFPTATRFAEQLDVPRLGDERDSTIPPPAGGSSSAPVRAGSGVSESFLRVPRIPRAPSAPDLTGEYGSLAAGLGRRPPRHRHPSLRAALAAACAGLGGGLFLGWLLGLY
jgi:hypothetical protein